MPICERAAACGLDGSIADCRQRPTKQPKRSCHQWNFASAATRLKYDSVRLIVAIFETTNRRTEAMPIRAEHRWLYPIDWPQLSATIRFGRAQGRCERCRRPHMARVWCVSNGDWWDGAGSEWRNGKGRVVRPFAALNGVRQSRVVLACAHLDHDPTHNAARNLAALCQRCHLAHDAREHRHQRWRNAFIRRALRDFFDTTLRLAS